MKPSNVNETGLRIQFNTGRLYTELGQRIVALEVYGGICFVDLDRGIDGFIPWVGNFEQREMLDIVMFAYDRGNYQWPGLDLRETIEGKMQWQTK